MIWVIAKFKHFTASAWLFISLSKASFSKWETNRRIKSMKNKKSEKSLK
jgi:hypothetical protein